MSANSDSSGEEWTPELFVGWDSVSHPKPLNRDFIEQARECNYDMVTTQISNDNFSNRAWKCLPGEDEGSRPHVGVGSSPGPSLPVISSIAADDTDLVPAEFNQRVVGFTNRSINICSPDPIVSEISRQILQMEIAYAAFCGIRSIFVTGPALSSADGASPGLAKFARAIEEALTVSANFSISILFPMTDESGNRRAMLIDPKGGVGAKELVEAELSRKSDAFGTWDAWNFIRTTCNYSSRLYADFVLGALKPGQRDEGQALMMPRTMPAESVQSRWLSEPLKAIWISSNAWVANKPGWPTLLAHSQRFLRNTMRLKVPPWVLLHDAGPIPGWDDPNDLVDFPDGFIGADARMSARGVPTADHRAHLNQKAKNDALSYLKYIRYLQRQGQPPQTEMEKYGCGYQDYLQVPLQPLAHNLESMTYEVFEKDPVKYDLYEDAMRKALRDWIDTEKAASWNGRVVMAVVGAGRGPLVTRALKAAKAEGVEIELWAVEKNPHAFVLLQQHNRRKWGQRVHLVQSDMREWKGPEVEPSHGSERSSGRIAIDILVSELLGSFADNELSPECLDSVAAHLAPQGVSIPQSYTAYLTPVAAPKIHADVSSRAAYDASAPETPAVVWLHGVDYLSTGTQARPAAASTDGGDSAASTPAVAPNVLPVWSFVHGQQSGPSPPDAKRTPSNAHNRRYAQLTFRTVNRGVCHGLAGYFEAVLYPGVVLSTHPHTTEVHSKGMISWFPFYFPLKTPIYLPDNAALTVSLWRQTDDRRVWYDWMVESWGFTFVLGETGSQRVRLGVSELHSSVKNAMLM